MKASEIRKGVVVMIEGNPCRVMDFQHRTPGNLRAFVQVRMRNLRSGNTFDTRFASTEDIETARLETKTLSVLYRDGVDIHVMDAGSFEQYTIDQEAAGDQGEWLQPEMEFTAEWFEGKPIAIQLPAVMELEVVDTAPIMKTATKTASSKPAVLSNGVTVQVPEFVGTGDRVRVDPRSGEYLERAK
ncbi:MAG: elongation factor P [Gemmatimonadales bacterium]|nr:elongation factor P [Gemmatimonadales bacterium]